MAQSIKLSDHGMDLVRKEIPITIRSLAGQVEYWMRIGRAIEKSGRFNYSHIKDALSGQISTDELSAEEQVIFLNEYSESMWETTSTEEADFEKYLGNGVLVGLDDDDNLVYENQGKH